MKALNVDVHIAKQEDGLWRASVPGLKGCWVDAETVQQALSDIQEVAAMVIDLAEELGEELPPSVSPAKGDAYKARVPLILGEHHFRRFPRRNQSVVR